VGEKQDQSFQLSFNPSLKVDFQGSSVTSDSGLLLVRELDERLGLSALIAENIMDYRRGKNTQSPLPDLLRDSPSTAAWQDTKTSTMPSGCRKTRPSA
jgi:predicted ribosome quality control (RQC) complex YloA/Tae2 family protein